MKHGNEWAAAAGLAILAAAFAVLAMDLEFAGYTLNPWPFALLAAIGAIFFVLEAAGADLFGREGQTPPRRDSPRDEQDDEWREI